jgi:hypothetical protein
MISGRRVDPHYPQASEITLLVAPITVSVGKPLLYSHSGLTNEVLSPSPGTFGLGKHTFSFLSGVNRPFYSGHAVAPLYI